MYVEISLMIQQNALNVGPCLASES